MCSSPSNNQGNISTFSMAITPSATTVAIDEPFTITVTSSETMKWMAVTTDGTDPVNFSGSDYGTSKVFYFTFDTLGSRIINIKVKNEKNEVVLKTITITVTRGNAIKITGLQVKSFYNINNTWDPEYAPTDINRLADVFFVLVKHQQSNPFQIGYFYNNSWCRSTVKENQGDLTWDLSSSNLYINPKASLLFGLGDKDGQLGQDLLMGPPDTKTISFSSYIATKPNTITYSFPEINLEFTVTVEWP
jgi:hypothetical protein